MTDVYRCRSKYRMFDSIFVTVFLIFLLLTVITLTKASGNGDPQPVPRAQRSGIERTQESYESRILNEASNGCGQFCDAERVNALITSVYGFSFSCRVQGTSESCDQCKCDEQCFSYGDCCPDLLLFLNTTYAPMFGTKCMKLNQDINESISINVVAMCSQFTVLDKIGSDCIIPNPYAVSDITPVINWKTGETYLNRRCAECNGVAADDIMLFQPIVECSTLVELTSFTEKDLIRSILTKSHRMVESCEFILRAPLSNKGFRYCEVDTISSCSKPSNDVDDIYAKACHQLHWNKGYGKYKSRFCALCDNSSVSVYSCINPSKSVEDRITTSLSVLLDFDRPQYADTRTVRDGSCSKTQIYDPIKIVCRNLICSPGKTLDDGTCTSVFAIANGLFYRFSVSIRSRNQYFVNISDAVILDLGKYLISQLKHNLFIASMTSKLVGYKAGVLVSPTVVRVQAVKNNTESHALQYEVSRISINARVITTNPHVVESFERALIELTKRSWYIQNTELLPVSDYYEEFMWENYLETESDTIKITRQYILNATEVHIELVDNPSSSTYNGGSLPVVNKWNKKSLVLVSEMLFCPMIMLDIDEYILLNNNSLYIKSTDVSLSNEKFDKIFQNGSVFICADDGISNATIERKANDSYLSSFQGSQGILSLTLTGISIVCLLLTIITYCIFPAMRTLPGIMNLCLAVTLMFAQIIFQFGIGQIQNKEFCTVIGIAVHFMWLSSFCWMNICSLHMAKTFIINNFSRPNERYQCRLAIYSLYTIITPAIIISITIGTNYLISSGNEIGYGGHICFLSSAPSVGYFFALPLGVIIALNLFFLINTIRSIRSVHQVAPIERNYSFTYLRLSTLTGITWLFGFLAEFFNFEPLWYLFIICNAGQGVLIFVSFIASKKTISMYREKISSSNCSSLNRKGSSSSRTKQSYVMQTNSTRL